ncbi:hypothetical protein PSAL_031070 [Pseudooceanicola algae]|uniref:PepSY-associated TM helix n=2 Tax=Pseudooceanicola algae TaxID=1537215 RepID=A0A418SJC2_9RHOB|nr:hypothetical protein PSAL_031070 [Pseudooceanicola algae]
MRQLQLWHWLTGAASLSTLIFFAVTGFVLNHPGFLSGRGDTEIREVALPAELRDALAADTTSGTAPLPPPVARWLLKETREPVSTLRGDFSEDEIWIDLPRPGGNGLALIDRAAGTASIEITRHGWLAVAADLHKGRDTGPAWSLVIDALALGALLFALSGLALLFLHARARPATWPVTAGGLALPAILFLLFIHA